jgi:nanoRNase/pAp phosphatase (c-di-AMP/oligoRNAs hydrolase)
MNQNDASPVLKRLSEFAELIPPRKRIVIIPHDYPDPDALASAAAIHLLLARHFQRPSTIVFSGEVSRAENRELLRRLRYRCHRPEQLRAPRGGLPTIFVDTTPWSGNVTVPAYAKPLAVFDHHRHKVRERRGVFMDIRAGAGATTTLVYEYLRAADISVPRWLAAIMCYAIASETLDLSRDSEAADIQAYTSLAIQADLRTIGKIRHAPLPRTYFTHLQDALNNGRRLDNIAWSHLRSTEQPEIVAEIADMLLRMEGIRWSFCTAHLPDGLFVSIRSSQRGAKCNRVVKSVIGRNGTAGGHYGMAAGFVRLGDISHVAYENFRLDFAKALVRRILKKRESEDEATMAQVQKLVERLKP